MPVDVNGGLCYEEHNGVIEMDLDAKIVPTYSFEEIRNQIEEKWKEEIKIKLADIQEKKNEEQEVLQEKLNAVQMAAEKEKDLLQVAIHFVYLVDISVLIMDSEHTLTLFATVIVC